MEFEHSSPTGGHAGYQKILSGAKADFYWKEMKGDLKLFNKECDACQWTKVENQEPYRLLQQLPIPTKVWTDISMDFVEGLPSSKGYNCIMVVVDLLTKYSHFLAIAHHYTTAKVAQ